MAGWMDEDRGVVLVVVVSAAAAAVAVGGRRSLGCRNKDANLPVVRLKQELEQKEPHQQQQQQQPPMQIIK